MTKILDAIFKDKRGKVVIWQAPNLLLWTWIACAILSRIIAHGTFHNGLSGIGKASIFAWAYLEITSGTTLFRKFLGAIVLAFTVASFFN